MFNLERAIAEWRRELKAGGIRSREVINELESHLRDDLEQQSHDLVDGEEAFRSAIQRLGQVAILESEFHKVSELKLAQVRLRDAFLTLAGIPIHQSEPMNTSHPNLEPWWATYLKAATFLVPAVFLWTLAAVFVLPKLQQICAQAAVPSEMPLWNLTLSNFGTMLFFKEHAIFIGAAIVVGLALLERYSTRWPRYRRATVGIGAFLFNSIVLVSIFLMILAAVVAAPGLFQHAR